MTQRVQRVVILGGGSAGWLVAGLLAAEHGVRAGGTLQITLLESPAQPGETSHQGAGGHCDLNGHVMSLSK